MNIESKKHKQINFTFSHKKETHPAFISEAHENAIINKSNKSFTKEEPCQKKGKDAMDAPIDPPDANMKALKYLKEHSTPGTDVDSRISAVQNLLGESQIFKTLQMLRWPQGIVCPRCHSSHVVRREPPSDTIDQRHYYVCLNCKGEGTPSEFDDFTDLSISKLSDLRRWILCWYLLGFCTLRQIAKLLGLTTDEVLQIASKGGELTSLPDPEVDKKFKKEAAEKEEKAYIQKRKRTTEEQEEYTRSASKAPLKPGYKTKK